VVSRLFESVCSIEMCNCGRGNRAARDAVPGSGVPVGGAAPQRARLQQVNKGPVIHDPVLWGPHLWTALHTLSTFVSFEAATNDWAALLTNLAVSLPCPDCTAHYGKWLSAHPFTQVTMKRRRRTVEINTSLNIATWLLDLHNDVNGRKGVSAWTSEQMTAAYGGDVAARRNAVRAAIVAIRGMVGLKAIQGLERLLTRM